MRRTSRTGLTGGVVLAALLLTGCVPSDADVVGSWYVESPFEDVCESGETIKVSWRTEPVLYSDAFCLVGRGAEAVLTVPTHRDEGATEYLDLRHE